MRLDAMNTRQAIAGPKFGAENERLAQKPEDLVIKLGEDRFQVTMNPHVSSEDTMIPFPKRFYSFEEALETARKVYQDLRKKMPHLPWPKEPKGLL